MAEDDMDTIKGTAQGSARPWVLGLTCVFLAGPIAHAQGNLWQVQTSNDKTVTATVTAEQVGSGGTIMTLLNVGFNAQRGCRAELGFAMLKGAAYGETVGKQSPPRTEPIVLMVDDVRVVTPAPTLIKYSNGWEAVSAADTTIVQAISAGTKATVRILSGTPTFELSISGAGAAIMQAQRQCAATR